MSILYNLTSTLSLKKIADGQKPWGNEARQNLDIIDAYFNYLLNSGKIQITNNANNVIPPQGTLNEAVYYINQGQNANTRLLSFSPSDYAFWMISGANTSGYTNGNEITVRLRWTSQYTDGSTRWNVQLASLNENDTIDPAFLYNRYLPISSTSTDAYGITTVEFTFTPNIEELQKDRPSLLKITRYDANDTGSLIGNDVLFFGFDIVYQLPEVTPQQVFNYFSGISEETSNIDFTYNANGLVDTVTETLLDGVTVRTYQFTYNADGQFDVITMTAPDRVFTETYTYDPITGNITNVSTTFVEV